MIHSYRCGTSRRQWCPAYRPAGRPDPMSHPRCSLCSSSSGGRGAAAAISIAVVCARLRGRISFAASPPGRTAHPSPMSHCPNLKLMSAGSACTCLPTTFIWSDWAVPLMFFWPDSDLCSLAIIILLIYTYFCTILWSGWHSRVAVLSCLFGSWVVVWPLRSSWLCPGLNSFSTFFGWVYPPSRIGYQSFVFLLRFPHRVMPRSILRYFC